MNIKPWLSLLLSGAVFAGCSCGPAADKNAHNTAQTSQQDSEKETKETPSKPAPSQKETTSSAAEENPSNETASTKTDAGDTDKSNVYTGSQFFFTLPEGWIIDSSVSGKTIARAIKANREDQFNPAVNSSFQIEVQDYIPASDEDSDSLKAVTANKTALFAGQQVVEDQVESGVFSGTHLSGPSAQYPGAQAEFYILDHWKDNNTQRARVMMEMTWFNEEDKADLDAILESLDISVADRTEDASETS